MFTGLIEGVGRIVEAVPRAGSTRIGVRSTLPADGTEAGASVAVDGVCLTVSERRGDRFWTSVVRETLSRTTLASLRVGGDVNLERSLRLGDRVGGHLVLGHVDGTAEVEAVTHRGDDHRLRLRLPPELERFVAFKGSVALQGVSLTVAAREERFFEVVLVPETLSRTTLAAARRGTRLNVEVDVIARYLEALVAPTGRSANTQGG